MVATVDSDIDTNYEMKDVSESAAFHVSSWTLLSCFALIHFH